MKMTQPLPPNAQNLGQECTYVKHSCRVSDNEVELQLAFRLRLTGVAASRQNADHVEQPSANGHRKPPGTSASGSTPATRGEIRDAVETALDLLDKGEARVADKVDGEWVVNQWLKKAVLLSFRLNDMGLIAGAPGGANWWDKVPSKFAGMSAEAFRSAGFRAVPGAVVRHSAYIAPGVVLMPSFVNLGAYVDSGTMVDTWATVGSCAQIGKNVHLSGGVGIGGVLEPLQANPTIIEDNCFIGARSEVVEGVIVGEGSVLAMGVFIGASTKIVDRATGKIHIGRVPPYSVVVSGNLPGKPLPDGEPGPSLYCAVIVKTVDAQTRSKTAHQRAAARLSIAGQQLTMPALDGHGCRTRGELRTSATSLGCAREDIGGAYRSLDPQGHRDISALHQRIVERFPGAGLGDVCAELRCHRRAELAARRGDRPAQHSAARGHLRRCWPAAWLLSCDRLLISLASTTADNVYSVLQGIEAAMNIVVLMGAALFFLVTIEERLKRRRALTALHELRSIVHVIDMHQLTKDPSVVVSVAGDTPSSPARTLSPLRDDALSRLLLGDAVADVQGRRAVRAGVSRSGGDRSGQRHRAHHRRPVAEDLAEDHDIAGLGPGRRTGAAGATVRHNDRSTAELPA